MVLKVWKNRLPLNIFSLNHENPDKFISSMWQTKQTCSVRYLAYRWIMTLFLVICWLLSVIDFKNLDKSYMFRVKWVIYLTNWGFTVCTLQALLCSFMLTERFVSIRRRGDLSKNDWTNRIYKFYWVLFTVALDTSFVITILYWAVIYDPILVPLDYLNILVHGMNSICMFIEFWVVAYPVKLSHFYLSFLFALTYTIFTIFYFLAGGTSRTDLPYIYKVIDWDQKPLMTFAISFGAMIFSTAIHVSFYFLHRFKCFLRDKLNNSSNKTQIPIDEVCRGDGQNNIHFIC